jgi:tight adherence protein C
MTISLVLFLQILTFALVVGGVILASRWAEGALAVRRRLGEAKEASFQSSTPLLKASEVSNNFLAWVRDATLKDRKEGNKLRKDLAEAGFEDPSAPVWYVIGRFSMAIGFPLLFILGQQMSPKPIVGLGAIMFPLILAGVGLLIPGAFLGNRVEARRTQLEQEFPDALDLMVVCVEAGLGIEAAFVRVSDEIKKSHPLIAQTFDRVSEELRAGRGRADALRNMAERVNVDSLKAFAALLIQTDALGTSIATTLRTFSLEMRETRFLKAEEKAMRIPTLMTVPLVACILPVIVTALLLPAAIDVVRTLGPALRGVGG